MGLDQYLYRAPRYGTLEQISSLYEKLSENEYAYREILEEVEGNQNLMVVRVLDQKKEILSNSGILAEFQKEIGGAGSLFVEIAYWRKFNALHAWFVRNCQDGIDECQKSEVTKDKLEILLEVLKYAYDSKYPSGFMPVGGFFFGSTEVDGYFWEQVEKTIVKLESIYKSFNFEKEMMIYQASW
jgi:hypothetical protein